MWRHVDTAMSGGNRLDLYERDGVHMIRVDGWELMNGEQHRSEDRLGWLAGRLARGSRPGILVGGLGLGSTLAGLLAELGDRIGPAGARVTVSERSRTVIDWFGRHTNRHLAATLPEGVLIAESDIADHLRSEACWDVIVLDVDNGPAALSAPGNAILYKTSGLTRAHARLRRGGHLLLWSSFADAAFVARARTVGFATAHASMTLPNRPDAAHVIYVLSKEPLAPGECDRLGLVPCGMSPRSKSCWADGQVSGRSVDGPGGEAA